MTESSPISIIYKDLNKLFDDNPNIDELGLILSTKDYDSGLESKPFILIESNKLGISFQFVSQLYGYCFTIFNQLRSDFDKLVGANPLSLSLFNNHNDLLKQINDASRNLLLVNAENLSALNMRKKLIIIGYNNHMNEIKTLNLIFTKHPKSGEAWCHRRWVLLDYKKKNNNAMLSSEVELGVCKRVAEIYPKNYYAWTHRWWVLCNLSVKEKLEDLQIIEDWVKRNISDYCGYHHRFLILSSLFNHTNNNNNNNSNNSSAPDNNNNIELQDIISIYTQEVHFINRLITLYPGHESPWTYKRLLSNYLLTGIPLNNKSNISNQIGVNLQSEYEFCETVIADTDSSYYQQQKGFAQRYLCKILDLYTSPNINDTSLKIDDINQCYKENITNLIESFPHQTQFWNYKLSKQTDRK